MFLEDRGGLDGDAMTLPLVLEPHQQWDLRVWIVIPWLEEE